jgi:hypothetical protein
MGKGLLLAFAVPGCGAGGGPHLPATVLWILKKVAAPRSWTRSLGAYVTAPGEEQRKGSLAGAA